MGSTLSMDTKLTKVPELAKQARDTRREWAWVEPSVWTDRMLTALEEGVKGGRWFSLIDKVASKRNLLAAAQRVAKNKGSAGVDHVTTRQFMQRAEAEIDRLHQQLLAGTYRPQPIRRVYIPKPGTKQQRPLGIPTVRDRVVQTALRHVLEPIFERIFAQHSYGFRPGRSCKDALRRVNHLLKAGYAWVVDLDLESYFDTIPHEGLLRLVGEQIADSKVMTLVALFLKQGTMAGLDDWAAEEGVPQGAVISPLLSNVYLNRLDHLMAQAGFEMVRYADDAVVLCRSEAQARQALNRIRAWMQRAGLRLHPEKTCLVNLTQTGGGFDFLGYRFERTRQDPPRIRRWPSRKSVQKVKARIREMTKRNNGHSLEVIIGRLNRVLRGWFEYFKQSVRSRLERLDMWIRMRLRSILRKRMKRKGRACGRDHQRWPNAYFRDLGLFSLATAWDSFRQSCYR